MKRTLIALAAATALVATACGDDSTETPVTEPAPTAAALDGRSFISQETTGIELVADSVLRLHFEDDRISANAGCNTMSGGYTITDGVLEVGAMAMTMMACDQPLMDQDQAIADFLGSSPTIGLDGDTLVLTAPDASITLLDRVVADPDRALEGTLWTVEGVISNEAVSSGWGDAEATLRIVDGEAAVMAGCNRGNASVEVGEDTLTFGPMALTKMMCEPEVMELETAVITVLDGEVTYTIEADLLIITNGTDGLQLRAER